METHQECLQRLRAFFGAAEVAPSATQEPLQQPAGPEAPLRYPHGGAQRRRSRTLPFPKEAVMRQLKEIMMDSFFGVDPKFILAMRAVEELSEFQPPLSRELQTSIVAWALGLVLGGSPGHEDPAQQALQQQGEVGLQRMLLALLTEDPSAGHWLTLLDQISYRLRVQWPAPRARASALLAHLLKDATRLPAFNTLESLALGHSPLSTKRSPLDLGPSGRILPLAAWLAKLAVSLADPDADVREKAREVIGQLLKILLCQQHDPGQGLSLQQAALEDVLSLARPWVREGGLVLLYTHLGQAHGLLEEEVEDLRHSLSALLYNLWWGGEVPAEIWALLPRTDDPE
ncbi:UNVERIFIED_CONTAM: hypothetical protein K2H54_009712 [Gekko kuhli]